MSTTDNAPASNTSRGQLYGGFFIAIFGLALGLVALILYFVASGKSGESLYNWREGALVCGAVALPFILFGFSLALPTKTVMRVLGVVGLGLTLVAAVLLSVHYPTHFNVQDSGQKDYTNLDTTVFAVGLAMLFASTFTSIIGYYVDRMRPAEAKGETDEDGYAPYEVPDWVVERDIEYAMKKHGVELVGGRGGGADKSMQVNIAGLGDLSNAKIGGRGKMRTVQLDAEQVDSGVAALNKVSPNKKGALPSEWADQSVAALGALRRQKAENPKLYRPKLSWWQRFVAWITGRSAANQAPALSVRPPSTPAASGRGPVAPLKGPTPPGRGPGASKMPTAPKRGKTIVIEDEK
jgi:hypothetical protein